MVRTVIREALDLYRGLFRRLVLVTGLIFLPLAIAMLALKLAVTDSQSTQESIAIIQVVAAFLLFVPLASIIAIRSAMASEKSESLSLRQAADDAFELLPTYVITWLLKWLVIISLPGILIVGGWISGSQLMLTLGFGTLLGSVILNGVRLGVATVAVVTGDARMAPALRHSAQLTRGRYWATLGVIVIFWLMAIAISLVLATIGLAAPEGMTQSIVGAMISVIANALTFPLIALGTYRLYRSLQDAKRV